MALKERIKNLFDALNCGIVERESFLQIIFLSLLTNQPIYVFGRSGSGKSLLIKRAMQAFKASKTLSFGKRNRIVPEDLKDFDMIHFMDFEGGDDSVRQAINIIFQEYEGKPIVVSGSRRAETTLSEAGIIDSINLSLSLPESLKPESLKELLASSFDTDSYNIPEELKVSPAEKEWWLSKIDKVTVSPVVLDLISKFSADCDSNGVYVSVRRWKNLLKMLKAIAYFNDREEVILTDAFLLGMPIWNRGRNNEQLIAKFNEEVDKILLHGMPNIGNVEEVALSLRQKAEHLLNAKDDVYDTVEYAGESCLKYSIKIAGENYPLYVPVRYLGTNENFNPFNELKQLNKHVLCNFEGTSECAISIDSSVRGSGLRSAERSIIGKSFEKYAKIPARVLESGNAKKKQENEEAFEKFRKSLDESMECFANAMIHLKSTYKMLKSYAEDPFFNATFYDRAQLFVKEKFDLANKMVVAIKGVRTFIDTSKK